MFSNNLLEKMFKNADIKTERQKAIEQMQAMQKAAAEGSVSQGEFELPPFLRQPAGHDMLSVQKAMAEPNMGAIVNGNVDDQHDTDNYNTVINTVPGTALPDSQVTATPIVVDTENTPLTATEPVMVGRYYAEAVEGPLSDAIAEMLDPNKSHVVVIDSVPGQ